MLQTLLVPDPLASIRRDVENGRVAVAEAEQELSDAAFDAASKPGDSAAGRRYEKAGQGLAAAHLRLETLRASLAAIERGGAERAAKEAAKAAAKALAKRWEIGEAAGRRRERAAKRLEAACAEMAAASADLQQATREMGETQLAYDSDGAMLRRDALDQAIALGIAKATGMDWMFKNAPRFLIENLAPLSARIASANNHFLGQRVAK